MKLNEHTYEPSLVVKKDARHLEAEVVECYPDWFAWTYRMRVAFAMLSLYASLDGVRSAEEIDDDELKLSSAADTWLSAVEDYYAVGHYVPYRRFNAKSMTVLSSAELVAVLMRECGLRSARAVLLRDASPADYRLARSVGLMYAVEHVYDDQLKEDGGGAPRLDGRSAKAGTHDPYPPIEQFEID